MKLESIVKKLSKDAISELDAMNETALNTAVIQSEQAINEARESLDENEKYQEAKENCKAMSAGYREVKAYQSAKIQYALFRLRELGK